MHKTKFKVKIDVDNTQVKIESDNWDIVSSIVSICTSNDNHQCKCLKDKDLNFPRKKIKRNADGVSRITNKTSLIGKSPKDVLKSIDDVLGDVVGGIISDVKEVIPPVRKTNKPKNSSKSKNDKPNSGNKRAIPVICITDNVRCNSIADAIQKYGFNHAQIVHSCKNNVPIGVKVRSVQFKFA